MEYSIIIAIVVTALMIMQVYMKRGIQAATKVAADQLAPQTTPDFAKLERGYLESANSISREKGSRNIQTRDYLSSAPGMDMQTNYDSATNAQSNESYNAGVYEEQ